MILYPIKRNLFFLLAFTFKSILRESLFVVIDPGREVGVRVRFDESGK